MYRIEASAPYDRCGDPFHAEETGLGACPACLERRNVLKSLWIRWSLMLALLALDLILAWSLRHVPLLP